MKENEIKGEGLRKLNTEVELPIEKVFTLLINGEEVKGNLHVNYNARTNHLNADVTITTREAFKAVGIKECCGEPLFIDRYLSTEEIINLVKNDECPAISDELVVHYSIYLPNISKMEEVNSRLKLNFISGSFATYHTQIIHPEYKDILKAKTTKEIIDILLNAFQKDNGTLFLFVILKSYIAFSSEDYLDVCKGKIGIEKIRISY